MATPRLDERPDARPLKVEDLLTDARAGRIRVPHFQRELRWHREHVLELFDSIYRGFPIGSLLLWQRAEPADRVSFGPVAFNAAQRSDALLVVDGQQRVTSLVAAMLHPDRQPRGVPFAIWFDLADEQFHCLAKGEPGPTWIPLSCVGDSVALSEWIDAWPYKGTHPELKSRAFLLGKRLREYELPAYVVKTADEHVARLVFKRVNTAGAPLDEHEVFDAIHGRAGSGKPLATMANDLAMLGFGRLDEEDLLACVKTIADVDPGAAVHDMDSMSIGPAIDACEAAIRRMFEFLTVDAGIPHLRLLPYSAPLVALARFFHRFPDAPPRLRTLLARWVWRGVATGVHAQATNQATRRGWQKDIGEDAHAAVLLLLDGVGGERRKLDPLAKWNERHAMTKLAALVLLAQNPRSVATGESYPTDAVVATLDRGLPLHRIFQPLVRPGSPLCTRFVILEPDELGDLIFDATSEPVLRSHLLTSEGAAALAASDEAAFLAARGAALTDAAEAFLSTRCDAADGDRPAIAEIVRQVDARLGR